MTTVRLANTPVFHCGAAPVGRKKASPPRSKIALVKFPWSSSVLRASPVYQVCRLLLLSFGLWGGLYQFRCGRASTLTCVRSLHKRSVNADLINVIMWHWRQKCTCTVHGGAGEEFLAAHPRARRHVCFTLTIPAGGLLEPLIRNAVIIHLTRSLLSYSFKHVTKHRLFFFWQVSHMLTMTMCCCGNDKLKRHLYTQTYSHNRTICNLLYSKKREANAERTTVLIRFVPVRCLGGAVWAGGASFFDFISFRGEKHCSFALKRDSSVVSLSSDSIHQGQ